MKTTSTLLLCCLTILGCSNQPPAYDPQRDLGLLWVKHSAEYRAITRQTYAAATAALPGFIEDDSWSVVPAQADAAGLPVAVILDVDETAVSNVDFQLTFERPFDNWKLEEWTVTVFFITNRPCEPIAGIDDPCPQKKSTIDDIAEVGIETDADHVLLSDEQGWNREKSVRREYVARTHRVVMLIGDDLQDFVPCVRNKVYAPCTTAASAEDRHAMVEQHAPWWGNGWYILPNPMHGSWTPVVPR
jgi:acid phosphatase